MKPNENPSMKNEAMAYAFEKYGSEPEYLWEDTPDCAVLRHKDNRKWYAVFMTVPKSKLGLPDSEPADILDVKCGPMMMGSMLEQNGFYPGYHMNKRNWITVLLDGSADKQSIFDAIDISFGMTGKVKKTKK